MKIRVLGTRGEIKPSLPEHALHSGVLVDDRLMLDIGEKEFLEYHPEVVFITHLHPDHAFFIVENPPPVEVPLYAPEAYDKDVKTTVIAGPVEFGDCIITPVPTHHSKKVKSAAYLVTDGRQRLLYTGDLIWINKEYHHLLEDLDMVITDGSYIRKGGMVIKDKETGQLYGHNGIPDLVNLLKKFTGRILFVHFGRWFYKDPEGAEQKLAELGRENGITIQAGFDGMEFELG